MSNAPTITLTPSPNSRGGTVHNVNNVVTTSSRPLTAVRLGPLTCFCACTPQKAAASTMVDSQTEFQPAEEVFDLPATAVNNFKPLPAPSESPPGGIFTKPPMKEDRAFNASQQPAPSKSAPSKSLPGELEQGFSAVQKQAVASKAPEPPKDTKTTTANEKKREPDFSYHKQAQSSPAKVEATSTPIALLPVETKLQGETVRSPADMEEKRDEGEQDGTEPPSRCCLKFWSILLAPILIVGAWQLNIWTSNRVPQAIADMRSRRCHIASREKVSTDPQSHSSYTFALGSTPLVTIPASFHASGREWFLPVIDFDWMAVTCWVSLEETLGVGFQRADGQVPLTIYHPENIMRPDLPPLACADEVKKLADLDDGFECSYAESDSENFGVVAASTQELSDSSFTLALWRYSRTGFPFAVFAACVLAVTLAVSLLIAAQVCFWKSCTFRCWSYSIVSISFLLTVMGIGWIGYQCNEKAQVLANLKGGSCELQSSDFRNDPQEHATYTIGVGGSQVTLPGSVSLRGHNLSPPVFSADWAMVTCWVDLHYPAEFEVVAHSRDGKVPLTWINPKALTRVGDSLDCKDGVDKKLAAKTFDCTYAEGAFGSLGILAVSKEDVPTTLPKDILVQVVVATRAGFPFVLCMVAACVTALFCVFKALQACGRCLTRRCKANTRARELMGIREPLLG